MSNDVPKVGVPRPPGSQVPASAQQAPAPQSSGDSDPGKVKTPLSNPPSKTPKTFGQKVKDFFKRIMSAIGVIFGVYQYDNKAYVSLYEELKQKAGDLTEPRAQHLASLSGEFIDLINDQLDRGIRSSELTTSGGVSMSGMQKFLTGNSIEQQYYNNCAVYNITRSQLSGKTILSFSDMDNTKKNKNLLGPEDTALVQSSQVLFWESEISRLAPLLGVKETILSARSPYDTLTGMVTEGLDEDFASAILGGAVRETLGCDLSSRKDGLNKVGIIVLNSSVIHDPGEPLILSAKVLRSAKLNEFLEDPNGPRIDGKTFREHLLALVRESGCSYYEPKALPKYLLDTQEVCGECYLPNYDQIIEIRKRNVDNVLANLGSISKEEKRKKEIEAWKAFALELKKNVDEGVQDWRIVDSLREKLRSHVEQLKKSGFTDNQISLDEEVKKFQRELKAKRKVAYEYIRLIGSDPAKQVSDDFTNYYGLISEKAPDGKANPDFNPQACFEKITEAVLIADVVHFYDSHLTPKEDFPLGIVSLHRMFANHPDVRRYVAKLNAIAFNGNDLHSDIQEVRDEGIRLFKEEGVRKYLEWRMLQYLADHYTKEELEDIKLQSSKEFGAGINLFSCNGSGLSFSEAFVSKSKEKYDTGTLSDYMGFIKTEFKKADGPILDLADIVDTFLPGGTLEERDRRIQHLLTINSLEELQKEEYFYPNDMFSVNNSRAYDDSYSYNKIRCVVIKSDKLNKQGQYYIELQPAREKYLGLPSFRNLVNKEFILHAAGDSKADIGMLAAALERNPEEQGEKIGGVDVVFNLIKDIDIYREMIKQRLDYDKEFKDDNDLYQKCKEKFGICALKRTDDGKFYKKIERFENHQAIFEKDSSTRNDKLYDEASLLTELKRKYRGKIVHNVSPEAYLRRRKECFSLLTGDNREFDKKELARARELYKSGKELNEEEKLLLRMYQREIVEEQERLLLPQDAPRFLMRRVWLGEDVNGKFIVYRSKEANGNLVIDRLNGSRPETFTEGEEALSRLTQLEVKRDVKGKLVFDLRQEDKRKEWADLISNEKLSDIEIENRYLFEYPRIKGLFANKTLLKIFGENKLKYFVTNLPNMFHRLLKYSGLIMGLGGVTRLVSSLFGGMQETVYRFGYWLSNSLRAISAVGGALRGELNVHRIHNIAFGEAINVVSSFLPNGVKHLGLGFGNFILFLGRGQQRAQLQQTVNNHTRDVLEDETKVEKEIDARPFVRKVTKLATGILLKIKNQAKQFGISSTLGEIAGNVGSGFLTSVQMLKDLFKKPGLAFKVEERMSEKSGAYYWSVPSPGHLLTLVGLLSGISAALAGTIGRSEKFGEEIAESGFNNIGKWFVALANAVPALGIIANAKEVMANSGGLPMIFRGLNGKDTVFDPLKAGLRQIASGIGFAVVPFFGLINKNLGLHNKYIASFFDICNGIYFGGAAEEEIPNATVLGMNIERKGQKVYIDPEQNHSTISNWHESAEPQYATPA